jgi:hypothetical protein
LHYAIWKGHKIIAQLLISKGADVNAKIQLGPTKGSTPLDMAIDEPQNQGPPPERILHLHIYTISNSLFDGFDIS